MSSFLVVEEDDEALDELMKDIISSSDSDSDENTHGGSTVVRAPNIDRKRQKGHQQLQKDYLAPDTVYHEGHFRRRFRILRNVFQAICDKRGKEYYYFGQRPDCRGVQGFSTEQKFTAAHRLLAYGYATDIVDEFVRMGE